MAHVLLLGGTTEASQMARALAEAGIRAVFSYAGRTAEPVAQPLPTRIGGFGGIDGLIAYLQDEKITHVIDATHPFAAQMSLHAIDACRQIGLPLVALQRPAWSAGPGDRWTHVADKKAAVAALPARDARVFLAIGKQNLAPFASLPLHYLLRLVDAPDAPPLPDCTVIIARGPFEAEADEALMRAEGITHLVAKNAGGAGAEAKLIAARNLGLPVILIDRPQLPDRQVASSVAEVMGWLRHPADLGV